MPEKKSPPITVAEHDHSTEPATKRVLLYGWDGSNKVRLKTAADGTLATSAVAAAGGVVIADKSNASLGATVFAYTSSNPLAVRLSNTSGDYVAGGGGSGTVVDRTNSSIIASVSSLTNSGALHTIIVDGSGDQITSFGGGTQYASNSSRATFTGTVALGFDGTQVVGLYTNSSGALITTATAPAVQNVVATGASFNANVTQGTAAWNVVATGASFNAAVTGTVTANQSAAPWNVVATGASFNAAVTGTVTANQSAAPWNVVATGASFNVTALPHTVYGTSASFSAAVTQGTAAWNVVATGASFNATVAAHTVFATAASFTATVSTGSMYVTVMNDAANSANWVSGTNASLIDTADYVIVTGSSGKKNYITQVTVQNSNSSYSSWVSLKDGASTVLYNVYAPFGGGGAAITLPVPLMTTASYAFVAAATTASVSIRVSASGFRGV